MANRIQLRRGGAQEWANANPTLAQGELGVELDTGRLKIGDGVTAWNSLRYGRPIESTSNTANTLVQRDADGNFAAGTITATLIGNASTAARLSSTRQIQLSTDITASGVFDGSANLNLNAELSLVQSLPHYDGTTSPTGTYTKVVVDAKGRIINASNPNTIQDYGLNGTVEGQSAQPYDLDLAAVASLTTTGLLSRTSGGVMQTRTIQGSATRIAINNGGGIGGNPSVDLITTAVVDGDYNTESLTSVSGVGSNSEPFGTETVNATKFTVDAYGRLTSATNVPIATATEGSKYASYNAGTTYSRYAIIQNASKVYQAIADISAGAGAPTHSSGDTGSWRYLAAEATEQKGLASFAQEDFDVDSNGHVTIAALGVDNTQLQNNRVSFADGNTKEDFELDQELTATTGYRGFNYLNYVKVNDTSGNLLFGANNTGDSGAGEIDVNVRSYFSDPDITLDGAVTQTLDKTGDGNLTFQLTQNSSSDRNLSILSTNAGSGTSTVTITAENVVDIDASDAAGKVHVEDARFQDNYIATNNAIMHLDPGDDRAVAGTVRVWGDLQVDGTTTTVNSTTLQVDDPIITLGGDTAPASDDNKDRGIEFRYYDTQARLGFYGWDTNYTDLGGHGGGYRFLHAATNTAEVFSGTDSGIIAGNVKLTTNTNSTSNTTGDLVVAGGAGIGQDVNIGGLVDIDSTLRVHSTSRFDDNVVLQGASKTLQLNNGSGTTRIELQSTTGNASFYGIVDITNDLNINSNKFNVASATGNTLIAGTLGVTNIATFSNDIDANANMTLAGDLHMESTNDITVAKNSGTGVWEIQSNDYGALRVDGGMYTAGDALIDGTLHVNGAIEVKDSATETESRLNWLRVRYRGRFGDTYQASPSYASHNTSTLKAHGGAGIMKSLYVGATGSGERFSVGKLNNGDTEKFTVIGASGDTTIQGTLLVEDNVNFNGTLDVDADFAVRNGTTDKFFVDNVTGNTNIEGTLTVDGHTELNSTLNVDNNVTFGNQLTVAGATEFNNTVDVDADFAVRNNTTDKFSVASGTGNTLIEGTLTVNDAVLIDNSNFTLNGNADTFQIQAQGTPKFTVLSDSGNTDIQGTLNVEGASTIDDTLGVTGVTSLTASSQQTLTGSYAADGALRVTGGVGIAKNLAIGEGLRVYGSSEFTSTVNINNNTNITGRVDITNTSDATTFADGSVALVSDGGLRVSKQAWVGGDFHVWDNANNRDTLTVDVSAGNADLYGRLVAGSLQVDDSDLIAVGTGDDFTLSHDGTDTFLDNDTGNVYLRNNVAADVGGNILIQAKSGENSIVATHDAGVDLYHNNVLQLSTTAAGVTIAGDLTINGTTTTVNSTVTTLDDPIITLGGDTAPASNDAKDRGVEFRYFDSAARIGFFGYDNSANEFVFLTSATNTSEVLAGTDSALRANSLRLTGSGTTLDVDANANIDGTLTVDGQIISQVTSGPALVIPTTNKINNLNADLLDSMTTASANTASTVVNRDSNGDFVANQITAASGVGAAAGFLGNASSADILKTARVITIDGVVNGNVSFDGSQAVTITTTYDDADITALAAQTTETGYLVRTAANTYAHRTFAVTASSGITLTNADGIAGNTTINVASSATNAANNLVLRDANGDFSAGVITATRFVGDLDANLAASTTLTKNLVPDTDSAYYIGLSSRRYTDVYGVNANFSGTITGNVQGNVTGDLTASSTDTKNIVPDTTETYYFGLSSRRWASVWGVDGNFSGVITGNVQGNVTGDLTASETATKNIVPDTTETYYFGLSSRRWSSVWGVDADFSGTIQGNVQGNVTGDLTASETETKNIVPDTTESYYFGLSTRRWSSVWGVDANFSGTITATLVQGNLTGDLTASQTETKSIVPDTDASYYLGLSTRRYSEFYGVNANFSGTINATLVQGNLTGDLTASQTETKNIIPDTTNAYYFGLSSRRWSSVWATDANFSGTITGDLTGDVTGTVSSLSNHDTDSLPEGSTNQYYTEAKVQTRLDSAFAQLSAMLNNLATSTTVTLNLSGNPVPGDVVSLNNGSLVVGTGYTTATAVATTSSGSGTGLTVDITAVAGAITAVSINGDGQGYAVGETITITGGNGDATINVATIKQMQVGNSIIGSTTSTTATITAIGSNSVTVDTVDGFFKVGEIASSGNVNTLTISTFA